MKRSAAPSYSFNIPIDPTLLEPFKQPRFSTDENFSSASAITFSSQSTQDPSEVCVSIDTSKPFRRFIVVYARVSTRKHKRWEDDGILTVQNKSLLLENVDDGRKRIAASFNNDKDELNNLGPGFKIKIGGYEVELQEEVFEQKILEYAILCAASDLQNLLFDRIKEMITLSEEETLDFMNYALYHPAILHLRLLQIQKLQPKFLPAPRILDSFPPNYDSKNCYVNESGKLKSLFQLVTKFNLNGDKAIVVASSTSALDMIESMFKSVYFSVFRIDKRTASVKEIQIKNFNAKNLKSVLPDKVLLMHSDSTTSGYSISSAKYLILFDHEACSEEKGVKDRVWRSTDGKGERGIYRFITSETFEEEAFRFEGNDQKGITVVNSVDLEKEFNEEEQQGGEEQQVEELNQTIPA